MLKFKEYIIEAYLDSYGGKNLISTIHYGERADERDADLPVIKHLFRKATDHLNTHNYGNQEEFLFYSNKHKRGVVFAHRADKYRPQSKEKQLVAVTILPKGKSVAKVGTKRVVVEEYSGHLEYIEVE